jgi:mono/diheme cytochrome c family protein
VSRATRSTAVCAALLSLLLAGCGRQIAVPEDSAYHRGAVLFQERCSGCHTLTPAGAAGSKPPHQVASNDRTNGPNLDQRIETVDDVLFAIRNGGFSGAIMPANIVVGQDAEDVADFVAKYAGTERPEELGGGAAEGGGSSTAEGGDTGQGSGTEKQKPPE